MNDRVQQYQAPARNQGAVLEFKHVQADNQGNICIRLRGVAEHALREQAAAWAVGDKSECTVGMQRGQEINGTCHTLWRLCTIDQVNSDMTFDLTFDELKWKSEKQQDRYVWYVLTDYDPPSYPGVLIPS